MTLMYTVIVKDKNVTKSNVNHYFDINVLTKSPITTVYYYEHNTVLKFEKPIIIDSCDGRFHYFIGVVF